jgi:glycosyltransferase involved in cell wall biosynthesis
MRFAVAADHIHVIPCGVDLERLASVPSAPFDGGPPLLVCVARHKPVKNLGLLLEACAQLRERRVEFRAILIGDGPCRPAIEAAVERFELGTCVSLEGALDHDAVLAWWRRASVAVLSSRREGLPVCLIEAAACGVPAVATQVGGTGELIEHGMTGLLTPPDDAPALAGALARLLTEPELAAAMGSAAQKRIERDFSLDRQVDAMLRLWSA